MYNKFTAAQSYIAAATVLLKGGVLDDSFSGCYAKFSFATTAEEKEVYFTKMLSAMTIKDCCISIIREVHDEFNSGIARLRRRMYELGYFDQNARTFGDFFFDRQDHEPHFWPYERVCETCARFFMFEFEELFEDNLVPDRITLEAVIIEINAMHQSLDCNYMTYEAAKEYVRKLKP